METLVLPGYGSWFVAQLGAMHGLREKGELRALKHVICTSGGSLACLAYLVGMGLEDVEAIMQQWTPVFDPTLLPMTWGVLTEASQLELMRTVEAALCACTGLARGFTFADLHARYPVRVTVIATDINIGAAAAFDHETHPDAPVIDAVSASIAIPFIFRPIQWRDRLYADGMVVLWSALRAFGDPQTMGVVSLFTDPSQSQPVDIVQLWYYANVIMRTIFQEAQTLFRYGLDRRYTCEVCVPVVHGLLKLPPESLRALYAAGLAAAEARPRDP